jgi:hypothetical protein
MNAVHLRCPLTPGAAPVGPGLQSIGSRSSTGHGCKDPSASPAFANHMSVGAYDQVPFTELLREPSAAAGRVHDTRRLRLRRRDALISAESPRRPASSRASASNSASTLTDTVATAMPAILLLGRSGETELGVSPGHHHRCTRSVPATILLHSALIATRPCSGCNKSEIIYLCTGNLSAPCTQKNTSEGRSCQALTVEECEP